MFDKIIKNDPKYEWLKWSEWPKKTGSKNSKDQPFIFSLKTKGSVGQRGRPKPIEKSDLWMDFDRFLLVSYYQ